MDGANPHSSAVAGIIPVAAVRPCHRRLVPTRIELYPPRTILLATSPDRPQFRSRPLRAFPFFRPRRLRAAILLAILGAVLCVRVAYLSTAKHEAYATEAARNPIFYRRLPAPRGILFDADGIPLTQNRRCYTLQVVLRQKLTNPSESDIEAILAPLEAVPHLNSLISHEIKDKTVRVLERNTQARLLSGLPQAAVIPLLERPESFPNLTVVPDFRREYQGGAAVGLLTGFTGPIPADNREAYPAPTYQPDDDVGRAGLEAQFERLLAGVPGVEERRQDARGRLLAPPSLRQPTVPGADIHTTMRLAWQDKAYQLLQNRKGSVVVVEVPSGAVRVLASYPSYDPSTPGAPTDSEGRPTSQFNRAIRGLYPPGSTFKPFVILGASNGGWNLSTRTTCTGSVRIAGWSRPFHCNVRSGHGAMDATRALSQSCNAYFYEIAADRGVSDFLQMAREYGFGSASGIELKGEAAGQVSREGRLDAGEELNLSIGQGTMLCNVAQVARAYAGLALGSEVPPLHLIERIVHADGTETHPDRKAVPLRPRYSAEARRVVLDGMARAVSDPRGTAHAAGFEREWEVCGKTGTAEKSSGSQDAWFAGFYPMSTPRYVVVVHIEESEGHGGEEAAPVAAELIRFMEAPPAAAGAMAGTAGE